MIRKTQGLLMELDKLKGVYRRAYLSDGSRNENSAEHSWHMAIALMALKRIMPAGLDVDRAIRIALVHDVCEIGAGDISIYDAKRLQKSEKEGEYLEQFASRHGEFGQEVADLWREYELQNTSESQWVKFVDRLLPFLLNIATEGKTWKEQDICRSQVLAINKGIADMSPEIFEWMTNEIEMAVKSGWLKDA